MNSSESGVPTPAPDQEKPVAPTMPTEVSAVSPTVSTEAATPVDTNAGKPEATMMPGNHMEATNPTVEAQPKPAHKGFFEKIGDFFRGKPKESTIPKSVVNTEPSPSAGMPSPEHEARVAELSNIGEEKKASNQPAVVWGSQRNETNTRLRSVENVSKPVDNFSKPTSSMPAESEEKLKDVA